MHTPLSPTVEHETLRGWVARTLGDCLDHNAFKSGEVAKFRSHVIPVSQRPPRTPVRSLRLILLNGTLYRSAYPAAPQMV